MRNITQFLSATATLAFAVSSFAPVASARLLFSNETDYTQGDTFVIDFDDNADGNIELQFGSTDPGTLDWNSGSTLFTVSDDFEVLGEILNPTLTGTITFGTGASVVGLYASDVGYDGSNVTTELGSFGLLPSDVDLVNRALDELWVAVDGVSGGDSITNTVNYHSGLLQEIHSGSFALDIDDSYEIIAPFNTISGAISNVDDSLSLIDGDITTIEGDIATIEGDVTVIDGDLADVENVVSYHSGLIQDVAALSGQLSSGTFGLDINGTYAQLDPMPQTLSGLVKNIDELFDGITGIDITDVENAVLYHSGVITTIDGDIITIEGDITDLGDVVAYHSGTITTLEGDLTLIEGDLTDVEDTVDYHSGLIEDLSLLSGQLSSGTFGLDMNDTYAQLDPMPQTLSGLVKNIDELFDGITDIDITDLEALVAYHSGEITDLDSTLTTLINEITDGSVEVNIDDVYENILITQPDTLSGIIDAIDTAISSTETNLSLRENHISLNAEFEGVAFTGSTNDRGTLELTHDANGNAYKWSTKRTAPQEITLSANISLPEDFDALASGANLEVDYSSAGAQAVLEVYASDKTGSNGITGISGNTGLNTVGFTTTSITLSDDANLVPGDTVELQFRMRSTENSGRVPLYLYGARLFYNSNVSQTILP